MICKKHNEYKRRIYFANETCNIFPIESSYHKVFNSSSKILSKTFQPSKFVISPRKEECINANSTNEKSLKYSKKNSINNKKEINYEYRPICRKLDFSDNSDNNYNYNNSNFSISDNENIEINEDFSDFSNDAKNSDLNHLIDY